MGRLLTENLGTGRIDTIDPFYGTWFYNTKQDVGGGILLKKVNNKEVDILTTSDSEASLAGITVYEGREKQASGTRVSVLSKGCIGVPYTGGTVDGENVFFDPANQVFSSVTGTGFVQISNAFFYTNPEQNLDKTWTIGLNLFTDVRLKVGSSGE